LPYQIIFNSQPEVDNLLGAKMTPTKSNPSPRLADPALLEKIDKLFAYNIGEYISLPQLVVVGELSSGKSSVLEGLTKMAFPRDSGLCTRLPRL
jgi:hypothetical protein